MFDIVDTPHYQCMWSVNESIKCLHIICQDNIVLIVLSLIKS